MKRIIYALLFISQIACKKDDPTDTCYTCVSELTVERPNVAIEHNVESEVVCDKETRERRIKDLNYDDLQKTGSSPYHAVSKYTCTKN